MRAGVYQRHLATLGGGERLALEVARHLALRGHQVELLAPRGTTLQSAGERLGVDTSGLRLTELDPIDPCRDAAARSAGLDLFVNCSHWSRAVNRAPRGIYVCHFPSPPGQEPTMAAVAREPAGRFAHATAACSQGMWQAGRGRWWTDGHGWIYATTVGRAAWNLRMWLGARSGSARGGARRVEIRLDGQTLGHVRLVPGRHRPVSIPLSRSAPPASHSVQLVSEARFNRALGRPLGVHVLRPRLQAPGLRRVKLGRGPSFLASYADVVANSAYTASWVRSWWGRDATVVPPAVEPLPVPPDAARKPSIVVVGRFFMGWHSKRQLELTHAFRELCESGVEGWTLDLVGGVTQAGAEAYLRRIRDAAQGLPVRIVTDASRAELARRVGEASILWQASGWGEDPTIRPDRFEHFGISMVEGMSAGTVPVALGVGGAAEIVRHEVDGILWTDSPVEATRALIRDPERRSRMSAAARRRAEAFDSSAFARRMDVFDGGAPGAHQTEAATR